MSKKLDVPQSGKVGTTVNVKTRYGQVQRQYVIPRDPQSPAQMRMRSNLSRIAARWRALSQAQRDAWTRGGGDAETRSRLGRSAPLTGFQFFLRVNCTRAALGLDQFVLPPPAPLIALSVIGGLSITNDDGAIALKLSVSGTPAQYTVVCAAAPCSAGKSSTLHYNILGFLPAPAGGLSDITDLYVGRYGRIPAGSRIFIQTYQHIDGWQDFPIQANAIVPEA